jgi:hypothetical protein
MDTYNEFLHSAEVEPIAAPILAQVAEGSLMPTGALALLKDALNPIIRNEG